MEPVKLVVAGPSGAGKSTLVRTIADLTVRSTDPVTGMAFDLGRITLGRDLVLYLYGAPAEPTDGGWAALSQGMLGALVVVDAAKNDGPARAKPHIEWFSQQDVPLLVAANRCPPQAVPLLSRHLGLPADVVIPLDVTERNAVRDLVIRLLEEALSAAKPSAVSMEIQARLS